MNEQIAQALTDVENVLADSDNQLDTRPKELESATDCLGDPESMLNEQSYISIENILDDSIYQIWGLIVSVPDHCLSFYFPPLIM